MSIELKIKQMSLAEESRIIRNQKNRVKRKLAKLRARGKEVDTWELIKLREHRKHVVGKESRAVNLARAYIKGYPYNKVENTTTLEKYIDIHCHIITKKIADMVNKYNPEKGNIATVDHIKDWVKDSIKCNQRDNWSTWL